MSFSNHVIVGLHRVAALMAVALMVLVSGPSVFAHDAETEEPIKVFYVHPHFEPLPWIDLTLETFRRDLENRMGRSVRLIRDRFDSNRLDEPGYEDRVVARLVEDCRDYKFDLMVTMPMSLDLLERHHDVICPDLPIIFLSILEHEKPRVESLQGAKWIAWRVDVMGTLDLMRTMVPDAERLNIVGGASDFDRWLLDHVVAEVVRAEFPLEVQQFRGLPEDDLDMLLAGLSAKSPVLYVMNEKDSQGRHYIPRELLRRISESSGAPIFGFFDTFVGRGLVGGAVDSHETVGKVSADLATRILRGEDLSAIPGLSADSRLMVDAEQARRHGIPLRRIPENVLVIGRTHTLWDQHRPLFITAIGIFVSQTALVVALVVLMLGRRKREKELREQREELRRIIDNLPGIFYRVRNDREWSIQLVSASCLELSGYSAGEFYGGVTNFGELTHPEDRERVWGEVQAALERREPYELSFRFITRHRGDRWMWERGQGVWNPAGELLCLEGLVLDVTDRHQAEKALLESEERYRTLFKTARDAIFVHHVNEEGLPGVFTDSNDAACAWLGYRREELLTMGPADLLEPDEVPRIASVMEQLLTTGAATFVVTLRRRDGSALPMEMSSRVFMLRGLQTVMTVGRDITERREAEMRLLNSEATLRGIMDTAPVGMGMCQNGIFLWTNSQLHKLLGYEDGELVGQPTSVCYTSGMFYEEMAAEYYALAERGETGTWEMEMRRKDGSTVEVLLSIAPTFERRLIFTALDISERKRAQLERHRLEEQLRQAQKMESIGQLAGGVAHDFNNILQAMMGCGELLLEGLPRNSEEYRLASQLREGTERAAALTRRLLAFSRKQVLDTRDVEINALIHNLMTMISRVIGEQVELNFAPAPVPLWVRADSSQLEQAIVNLCVNARDAMPAGGTLRIETSVATITHEATTPTGRQAPGTYVAVTVTDTGVGMDEQVLAQIFDPFFTTKDVGKGTGLGLPMVVGIIQHHQGFIEVESAVGKGATFRLYLPLQATPSVAETRILQSAPRGGTETILLAEDDEAVRELTIETLRGAGYSVIPARDGEDARQLLKQHQAPIDLLLTDLVMPKVGGRELYEIFRARNPEGGAVFMSGYSAGAVDSEFLEAEQIRFLQKPFRIGELLSTVREALDPRS